MLRPSGSACSTSTVAPSRRSTSGAMAELDPLAQSMTTCRPSSRRPSTEASSDRHQRSMSSAAAAGSTAGTARSSVPGTVGVRDDAASRRSSSASRSASTASDSFTPPAAKNLMPLSPNGLCEAEIIAPGTPRSAHTHAMVGVGTTPSTSTTGSTRGQAPGQRRFDPRPGRTGVATDDEARPVARRRRAPMPRRGRAPRPARR